MSNPLPAQQDWVTRLSIMQQSVLFAAVRAPDGLRKDHPVKVIMRWYRRSVLISAFDGKAILDPFTPGGGSFTGPFTLGHAQNFVPHDFIGTLWSEEIRWRCFNHMREIYLRHVDEMPHHFQLHMMHAAEIVGYKHPDFGVAQWWRDFYHMIVNDAHLHMESEAEMDARLSDNEAAWRARETVTAK